MDEVRSRVHRMGGLLTAGSDEGGVGGIRVGRIADIAVVHGNPLDNFKVLYGLGYCVYGISPCEQQPSHGGVKWTIKDGIVFDARALLREAERYVEQE